VFGAVPDAEQEKKTDRCHQPDAPGGYEVKLEKVKGTRDLVLPERSSVREGYGESHDD
jgi:hypothetical protein